MSAHTFDLNIEEVLENWEIEHALREIIANAIDEQVLSSTADIRISKDSAGRWRIRDFGRGLRIEHFTLNEDKEKLSSTLPIIGKFGAGLKDALATFHRRGVDVIIRSPFGQFRLAQLTKHGFDNIVTLHVQYDDTPTDMVGTEFTLAGVSDSQVDKARSLFLRFSHERIVEQTPFGAVIARAGHPPSVFILGVLANEEPNFLFSYNITSLTPAMKKRLNRERLNVGRGTYTDRIKAILRSATSTEIKDALIAQLPRRASGDQTDELQWIEVSQHALTLMHEKVPVAYVTEEELQIQPDLVGHAKTDGLQVVVITEQQKQKVEAQAAAGGPQLRTLDVYAREFNESFHFQFVEPANLTAREHQVFSMAPRIFELVGITSASRPKLLISETMRITATDTEGVWDSSLNAIVIKRPCLSSIRRFAGTVLHEAAHATSGAPDVSRQFEGVLTDYLGAVAEKALIRV